MTTKIMPPSRVVPTEKRSRVMHNGQLVVDTTKALQAWPAANTTGTKNAATPCTAILRATFASSAQTEPSSPSTLPCPGLDVLRSFEVKLHDGPTCAVVGRRHRPAVRFDDRLGNRHAETG